MKFEIGSREQKIMVLISHLTQKTVYRRQTLMLVFMVFGFSLVHSNSLLAQEALELQSMEAETAYAPGVQQVMDDFLNDRKWSEGHNTKPNGSTFLVVTGVGTVAADTASKSYVQSRVNAYNKAVLDAKKNLIEFLEVSITTELGSEYKEPGPGREQARLNAIIKAGKDAEEAKKSAAAKVSALKVDAENKDWLGRSQVSAEEISAAESAEAVLRAGLEEEIRKLGLNSNEPVDGQVIKKILSQEKFRKASRIVGQARIAGLGPFRTFEVITKGNKGLIGVVMIHSAKTEQIADALFSGDMSRMPRGIPKKPLMDQISKKKAGLISEFGVRTTRDETGQFWLLSYGQSAPKTSSERSMQAAMSKAKLEAQSNLRLFLGSVAATASISENVETVTELEDGSEIYENDESFEEVIKDTAATLKISGMSVKKRWAAEHPLTKHQIAGVVVGWSPTQMLQAKAAKSSMREVPPAASGGGQSSRMETSPIGGDAKGNYDAMGGAASDENDF